MVVGVMPLLTLSMMVKRVVVGVGGRRDGRALALRRGRNRGGRRRTGMRVRRLLSSHDWIQRRLMVMGDNGRYPRGGLVCTRN